jgi:hypothetical protein
MRWRVGRVLASESFGLLVFRYQGSGQPSAVSVQNAQRIGKNSRDDASRAHGPALRLGVFA